VKKRRDYGKKPSKRLSVACVVACAMLGLSCCRLLHMVVDFPQTYIFQPMIFQPMDFSI
jgi:hypothetical protein